MSSCISAYGLVPTGAVEISVEAALDSGRPFRRRPESTKLTSRNRAHTTGARALGLLGTGGRSIIASEECAYQDARRRRGGTARARLAAC